MMGSKRMEDNAGLLLLNRGFTVKSLSGCCFDMIARKGSRILLIKAMSDANALSEHYAEQMSNIGRYMDASPVIIAERAGGALEDNVVYSRNSIYTVNQNTFRNIIDNRLPYVFSSRAGLSANLDSERLRAAAEDNGMSISDISRRMGVSRRMMARYEAGSSITLSRAQKIYGMFGHSVFEKIDIFSGCSRQARNIENPITRKYCELGFDASGTRNAPFDVVARKQDELILTEVGDRAGPHSSSLSRLVDADSLLIFSRKRPKDSDIPSLAKDEFMEFEESDDLIRFLKES